MTSSYFGLIALLLLPACGSDDDPAGATGKADLAFTTYGEEFVEDGIPADEIEDGWSAKFDKFLIVLGDVRVADDKGNEGARLSDLTLFDMTKPGPHPVGTAAGIGAKHWNRISFRIPAANADTKLGSTASQADLDMMQQAGYSVYVTGSATRGSDTKTFAWGFTESTTYSQCTAKIDGKEEEGVVLANGANVNAELTIHGDHFFYDDLSAETAVLRFDAIASADANQDGVVTLEELAAVKLFDIPEGSYQTGAANIDDLRGFITALVSTLGHFRGEGHCAPTVQ